MKRIPLRNRTGDVVAQAQVNNDLYGWLMGWRWHRDIKPRRHGPPVIYARAHVQLADGTRTGVQMQRLVVGLERGDRRQVDHEDGDGLNNLRSNLRVCERGARDNQQNRKYAFGRSAHRGVHWDKARRKWMAKVKLDGKDHYLGRYADELEAAAVAAAFRAQHMPYAKETR